MTKLVPREDIERIVGFPRQRHDHVARLVSAEGKVYILHSRECLESSIDLRYCSHSLALDAGIDEADWPVDQPLLVYVTPYGKLSWYAAP